MQNSTVTRKKTSSYIGNFNSNLTNDQGVLIVHSSQKSGLARVFGFEVPEAGCHQHLGS
jgi:hypothetical protein